MKRKRHTHGEVSFSVSMAQWRNDSGSLRAQKEAEMWMKNQQVRDGERTTNLHKVLLNTPPPKTPVRADFLNHCKYICKWLPDILAFKVKKKKVRRLRFQSYIQREAEMDALCMRLCGGRSRLSKGNSKEGVSKAIVVFGAATCSSGFGYFPGPIKELRKRLERHTNVVVLDEHYNSQRCSRCAFLAETELTGSESTFDKLEPGKCGRSHWKKGPGGTGGRRRSSEIHGVRFCPHVGCRKIWNRDVNAARNMRLVFEYMVENKLQRPDPFKHIGALTN